jgi:hypothetical protein
MHTEIAKITKVGTVTVHSSIFVAFCSDGLFGGVSTFSLGKGTTHMAVAAGTKRIGLFTEEKKFTQRSQRSQRWGR